MYSDTKARSAMYNQACECVFPLLLTGTVPGQIAVTDCSVLLGSILVRCIYDAFL